MIDDLVRSGEYFVWEAGSYSDFGVHGFFRATRDITLDEIRRLGKRDVELDRLKTVEEAKERLSRLGGGPGWGHLRQQLQQTIERDGRGREYHAWWFGFAVDALLSIGALEEITYHSIHEDDVCARLGIKRFVFL